MATHQGRTKEEVVANRRRESLGFLRAGSVSDGHLPFYKCIRLQVPEVVAMVPVFAPRFNLYECNSELEKEFIEALHQRSELDGWLPDAWVWDDRVVIAYCPCDNNSVLRTLRVDFNGLLLRFGPDETHQFVTELDPARQGVFELREQTIQELAEAAADWLVREMRRPIVRHEWDRLDRRGVAPRLWVLADTGEGLSARGQLSPNFGPPDRIVSITTTT